MRGAIDWIMIGVVDSFDDVSLLPDPGVRKNGVSRREIIQIGLERSNVYGRAVRDVVPQAKVDRDFLDVIESGDLTDAHAHRVSGMDQAVGNRLNTPVGAVGISGRP